MPSTGSLKLKPLVYIAGPYQHPDPIENTRTAIAIGDAVVAFGGVAVIPHLSMLWHLVSPQPVDEWYARDLDMLAHCHALVRFPGESKGADTEVAFAHEQGISVLDTSEFGSWIREWRP